MFCHSFIGRRMLYTEPPGKPQLKPILAGLTLHLEVTVLPCTLHGKVILKLNTWQYQYSLLYSQRVLISTTVRLTSYVTVKIKSLFYLKLLQEASSFSSSMGTCVHMSLKRWQYTRLYRNLFLVRQLNYIQLREIVFNKFPSGRLELNDGCESREHWI